MNICDLIGYLLKLVVLLRIFGYFGEYLVYFRCFGCRFGIFWLLYRYLADLSLGLFDLDWLLDIILAYLLTLVGCFLIFSLFWVLLFTFLSLVVLCCLTLNLCFELVVWGWYKTEFCCLLGFCFDF